MIESERERERKRGIKNFAFENWERSERLNFKNWVEKDWVLRINREKNGKKKKRNLGEDYEGERKNNIDN